MPHHQSRQPRPMGGTAIPGSMMGFVPGGRLEHRSDGMMMPPHGIAHPHTMPTWMPGPHPAFHHHPSNLNHHHHHHQTPPVIPDGRVHHQMPIMSKTVSYDSSSSPAFVASPAHLSPKQDYSSLKTSKLSSPSSFDNNNNSRPVVSSVPAEEPKVTARDEEDHSLSTERSRPLKKRKTVTPHVSPMSAHTATEDRSAADTTLSSYPDKPEPSPKTDDNKVTPIAPKKPTTLPHVLIPQLPTVLHKLLTDSEYADKVVQWLPHGKAWRIVRWEALRRQVLPEFFPQLGASAGSVDAFMWHLTAWGFEEITDGTDVGAYSHPMFCKDDPELCRQMRFTPGPDDDSTTTTSAQQEAPEKAKDSHSILRVPSLATPSTESSRRFVEINHKGPPSPPTTHGWSMHTPPPPPVMVNYRSSDEKNHLQEWSGAIRSRGMPPYSPIRIRSSRGGGSRMTNNRRPMETRRGYPVSNRGRRPPAAQRSVDDNKSTAAGGGETSLRMLEDDTNKSDSQPRSVLKRRLPLSTSSSKEMTNVQQEVKPSMSNSSSSSTESSSTAGSA